MIKELQGQSAIKAFQPTYRHHHLPLWFSMAIRQLAKRQGKWRVGRSVAEEFLPSFFDHWGSFENGWQRSVAIMPYHADEEEMERFANDLKCSLVKSKCNMYHNNATLYVFTKEKP